MALNGANLEVKTKVNTNKSRAVQSMAMDFSTRQEIFFELTSVYSLFLMPLAYGGKDNSQEGVDRERPYACLELDPCRGRGGF